MPRKPVGELTPEELEVRREYMRDAKRRSRAGKPPENDKRGYRGADRIAKQRARRKADDANINESG